MMLNEHDHRVVADWLVNKRAILQQLINELQEPPISLPDAAAVRDYTQQFDIAGRWLAVLT